ncbi:HTH domain-containing protein [Labilibaculum sp. A4]|uniref:HTH domain-containing protein n=1 Tax=Labilibaculum euxinus TaxID=2686357 RepID=UPI000F61BD5F|nr:HTH domain-containing protein [Labilibaculum euxinus]MDQ1772571.1 HTH domain-containing protein [Labilibaculum euxinus]MWN78342.1 HTH domain-containing protein [Labilibaculum euxinus]
MTHLDFLEKTEYIKKLINTGNTGTPAELAQRLNISERSLFRLIKTLKENKNPITYSRTKQSYIID